MHVRLSANSAQVVLQFVTSASNVIPFDSLNRSNLSAYIVLFFKVNMCVILGLSGNEIMSKIVNFSCFSLRILYMI